MAAKRNVNKPGKSRKAVPLVRPPKLPSRKRARKVTTEFHRLTKLRDEAKDKAQVQQYNAMIEEMGGREEYQRASQTSTSFFSTSKWVLGHLARSGWLYGTVLTEEQVRKQETGEPKAAITNGTSSKKAGKKRKRPTHLLEIGAINHELLDASQRTVPTEDGGQKKQYNLQVRALDLNAILPGIEQADFLEIPRPEHLYDVIVCSMVLNCVPNSVARGQMVAKMADFLRPGGLLFFTLPRTCLELSPYIDRKAFQQAFAYVGLEETESKNSPKVAFFVFRRTHSKTEKLPPNLQALEKIRRGKKFRNEFAVVFDKSCQMQVSASDVGESAAR